MGQFDKVQNDSKDDNKDTVLYNSEEKEVKKDQLKQELNNSIKLENGGVSLDSVKNIIEYKNYLFISEPIKVDQRKIDNFSEITGDHNPAHSLSEESSGSIFGGVVAHGFLSASLMANDNAIWKVFKIKDEFELIAREFNVKFLRPVHAGSEIIYEFMLKDANPSKIKNFDSCIVDWEVAAKVNNKKVLECKWQLEYIDKNLNKTE